MDWAVRQVPKTSTEKLVLMLLADHHNHIDGRCDPSTSRLAKRALISKRQAIRCIESLEEQGFISTDKGHGRRTSYRFDLSITGDTGDTTSVAEGGDAHDTTSPGTGDTRVTTLTGDTHDTGDTHVTTTGDTGDTTLVTPMSPEPGTNREGNRKGARKRAEAKPRNTPVPDDFPITDAMREYFDRKGVPGDIEDVTEHFLTHHRAKGTKHVDWYAAWQLWCRNQIKFAAKDRPQGKGAPYREL